MKKPEVYVIAGPNGSGKSTITALTEIKGSYINADDIKRVIDCSDLEAAQRAEDFRERMLLVRTDFETVLSTTRNYYL